jgi:asparagine synthase (glutamine-hydrolysing)
MLSKISVSEIATYTQNVLLRDTDQMSMAHALEVRVPFFDHNLIKFVLGVPDKQKPIRHPKQLLVDSLGDLLPSEVVNRPKMGFVFPWEHWLRHELKDFAEQRIRRLQARGLIQPDELGKVWTEFQAGKGPWLWTHIWLPVVLEEWMESNGIEQ